MEPRSFDIEYMGKYFSFLIFSYTESLEITYNIVYQGEVVFALTDFVETESTREIIKSLAILEGSGEALIDEMLA